jgi:hypothetical protein
MTAGVGEHHHAETRAGRASRAIFTCPALLRRGKFRAPQDAAHGLAADGEVLLAVQFLREMRIIETGILAAGQGQNQLLLGRGKGPRHRASTIAVLHPGDGIGSITPLQPLYLALTQLQQTGGFAYAASLLPHSRLLSRVATLSDSWSPS